MYAFLWYLRNKDKKILAESLLQVWRNSLELQFLSVQKRSNWCSLLYIEFIHLHNYSCSHLYLVLFQKQLSKRHRKIKTSEKWLVWKMRHSYHKGGTRSLAGRPCVLALTWVLGLVLTLLSSSLNESQHSEVKHKPVTVWEYSHSCSRL